MQSARTKAPQDPTMAEIDQHIAPESPLALSPERLEAAPERVVIRPFHLGWQGTNVPSERSVKLIDDILALSEDDVETNYRQMLAEFDGRHWQIESVFDQRFQ